ncbi:MAG: sulfur carrier protein ThiS [Acidimicrobiales bacterium]
MSLRVVANGQSMEMADGATVATLLESMSLGSSWVLVERNGQPVERSRLGEELLANGDRLEIVRAVAGGAH